MAKSLSAFERCVYGQPGEISLGLGVPDGSSLNSIVIDHRQTFVLRPIGGGIVFALTPSYLGALAMSQGSTTALLYTCNPASGVLTNLVSSVVNFPVLAPASQYLVLPFQEWLGQGALGSAIKLGNNNFGSLNVTQARVITNKARMIYTGTSLANSGTCAIARQNIKIETIVPGTDTLNYNQLGDLRQQLGSIGPGDVNSVMALAGSQIVSAGELRCGYDLLNVPYNFDYENWVENASPVFQVPVAGNPTPAFAQALIDTVTNLVVPGCAPGIGHAPTTFVAFSGLDTTASITVTCQTCVEYTVGFNSPLTRFATMSPSVDNGAMDRVKEMSRGVPVIKPAETSWIANALSTYASGMKDIYMGVTGTVSEMVTGHNIWDNLPGAIRGGAQAYGQLGGTRGVSTRMLTNGMRGMIL